MQKELLHWKIYSLSLSDTLAELVINHKKPGRPINTGSEITKQAPLQTKIPQSELPQLELSQSESPQPASPQALPKFAKLSILFERLSFKRVDRQAPSSAYICI